MNKNTLKKVGKQLVICQRPFFSWNDGKFRIQTAIKLQTRTYKCWYYIRIPM